MIALALGLTLLDGFEDLSIWRPIHSEGAGVKLSLDKGVNGEALRIDYDFKGGGGYVIAERKVDLVFPENYTFRYQVRAEGPRNNLEFKLSDASGDNVWWQNRINFQFPVSWQALTSRKRNIRFAWGPRGGGEIGQAASLQFAIAAYAGGRGTVWIDDLEFIPLPKVSPLPFRPLVSSPTTVPSEGLILDAGALCEIGGVALNWQSPAPRSYQVDSSADGNQWDVAKQVVNAKGQRDLVQLGELEARYLRVVPVRLDSKLTGASLRGAAFGATANGLYRAAAKESPKGWYPRMFNDEMVYWTIVGAPQGRREFLIDEDGRVELRREGPSLEPVLREKGRLVTWADVQKSQSLEQSHLPLPTVTWKWPGRCLTVSAVRPSDHGGTVRYRLTNLSKSRAKGSLLVALRPFQVNPPWQDLRTTGGFGALRSVKWEGATLSADGVILSPSVDPIRSGASRRMEGDVLSAFAHGGFLRSQNVQDEDGMASAGWEFAYDLAPGASKTVDISISETGKPVRTSFTHAAKVWSTQLNKVQMTGGSPEFQELTNIWKANLGYILVNQDGPSIQPGSRVYERSWIRDGSMEMGALLRTGHFKEARDFLVWYAQYVRADGYVPCVVDHRGADPVIENDSHGQFLYALAEYFRFTGDKATVTSLYPTVVRVADYLDRLRKETEKYRGMPGIEGTFAGLVPESISHEGYSAKPMHSYWDCFWTLKGFRDAAEVAGRLRQQKDAVRFVRSATEFSRDFYASVDASMKIHGITYFPGCAELGDFDATSTAIGIYPCGEPAYDSIVAAFERYWKWHLDRESGKERWTGYTPYELRTISAMLVLGQTDRAHRMLSFFRRHIRPQGWNHWAEVVWNAPRLGKFVGDMPHTWVGSEYIRAFRNFLALEFGETVFLGLGLRRSWLSKPIKIANLPLSSGAQLKMEISAPRRNTIRYTLQTTTEIPNVLSPSRRIPQRTFAVPAISGPTTAGPDSPGRRKYIGGTICVRPPYDLPPPIRATVDGKPATITADGVCIKSQSATVQFFWNPTR
ncbi:MAG: hypothetical protein K1X67_13625 [Fimbriimonadaceae bacterium]|nr:hypothetical protein [Fimbriimonadaceae bacterium]